MDAGLKQQCADGAATRGRGAIQVAEETSDAEDSIQSQSVHSASMHEESEDEMQTEADSRRFNDYSVADSQRFTDYSVADQRFIEMSGMPDHEAAESECLSDEELQELQESGESDACEENEDDTKWNQKVVDFEKTASICHRTHKDEVRGGYVAYDSSKDSMSCTEYSATDSRRFTPMSMPLYRGASEAGVDHLDDEELDQIDEDGEEAAAVWRKAHVAGQAEVLLIGNENEVQPDVDSWSEDEVSDEEMARREGSDPLDPIPKMQGLGKLASFMRKREAAVIRIQTAFRRARATEAAFQNASRDPFARFGQAAQQQQARLPVVKLVKSAKNKVSEQARTNALMSIQAALRGCLARSSVSLAVESVAMAKAAKDAAAVKIQAASRGHLTRQSASQQKAPPDISKSFQDAHSSKSAPIQKHQQGTNEIIERSQLKQWQGKNEINVHSQGTSGIVTKSKSAAVVTQQRTVKASNSVQFDVSSKLTYAGSNMLRHVVWIQAVTRGFLTRRDAIQLNDRDRKQRAESRAREKAANDNRLQILERRAKDEALGMIRLEESAVVQPREGRGRRWSKSSKPAMNACDFIASINSHPRDGAIASTQSPGAAIDFEDKLGSLKAKSGSPNPFELPFSPTRSGWSTTSATSSAYGSASAEDERERRALREEVKALRDMILELRRDGVSPQGRNHRELAVGASDEQPGSPSSTRIGVDRSSPPGPGSPDNIVPAVPQGSSRSSSSARKWGMRLQPQPADVDPSELAECSGFGRRLARLPELEAAEIPPALDVRATPESGCDGRYDLVQDVSFNGFPLWRRSDASMWVFSGVGARWYFGDRQTLEASVHSEVGLVKSAEPHWCRMPDAMMTQQPTVRRGTWLRCDGTSWLDESSLYVNRAPELLQHAVVGTRGGASPIAAKSSGSASVTVGAGSSGGYARSSSPLQTAASSGGSPPRVVAWPEELSCGPASGDPLARRRAAAATPGGRLPTSALEATGSPRVREAATVPTTCKPAHVLRGDVGGGSGVPGAAVAPSGLVDGDFRRKLRELGAKLRSETVSEVRANFR